MKRSNLRIAFAALLLLLFTFSLNQPLVAQEKSKKADTETSEEKQDSTKEDKEKSFKDIITDEAESMFGLFNVHKVEKKYYFEIPDSIFGRDIMAITRMAKTPTGAGYGGEQSNRQVIRFEKGPDKNVFLCGW
jgi:hypothetical protein